MDGYICLKACTLGGTDYIAGDVIPTEAVLPNRVRALTRQKYIASTAMPQTTADKVVTTPPETPQNEPQEPALLVIPIKAKDGWMELNMAPDDVAGAISVLQMNAEDAVKAVEDIPNEEPLILIDALDARKTVKAAIATRVETLKAAEDGGQDGDQDKEPGTGDQPPPDGSGDAGGQNTGDA